MIITQNRRREFLRVAAGLGIASIAPSVRGHGAMGPVRPPLAAPLVTMVRNDAVQRPLASLLSGKVSAVQLMFTGCSSVCPIQGALFQAAQRLLNEGGAPVGLQLVSLSVDPMADDPRALTDWLRKFDAGPRWIAAAPRVEQLDPLRAFFAAASPFAEDHSTQVFCFDRNARLVFRTQALPTANDIATVLGQIAQR